MGSWTQCDQDWIRSAARDQLAGSSPSQKRSPLAAHVNCPWVHQNYGTVDQGYYHEQPWDGSNFPTGPHFPGRTQHRVAHGCDTKTPLPHVAAAGTQPPGGPITLYVHRVTISVNRGVV